MCVCLVYEYVADSEEATLSQCESVRSIDDMEFRSKTQQFFDGMARLRQELVQEQQQQLQQQPLQPQPLQLQHQPKPKTAVSSRSFYPRRVSDNITHRYSLSLSFSLTVSYCKPS